MFIRDSRRSCRAYSYAGLILITDLFSVGTPVGVTELILVLWNLYGSYGTYTGITELVIVLRILFLCESTRRYDKSEQIRLIQIHIRYGH